MDKVQEIAITKGYTKQGEMFSVDNMADLAGSILGKAAVISLKTIPVAGKLRAASPTITSWSVVLEASNLGDLIEKFLYETPITIWEKWKLDETNSNNGSQLSVLSIDESQETSGQTAGNEQEVVIDASDEDSEELLEVTISINENQEKPASATDIVTVEPDDVTEESNDDEDPFAATNDVQDQDEHEKSDEEDYEENLNDEDDESSSPENLSEEMVLDRQLDQHRKPRKLM